jgi:hypothetical protein
MGAISENWGRLKGLGIKLLGNPLGRPSEKNRVEYDPGDRNPIEGKFSQAKVRYGLDRIKARLKDTSESLVAMILVVMNLVGLAKEAPYFWFRLAVHRLEEIFLNMIRKIRENQMHLILFPEYRMRIFQQPPFIYIIVHYFTLSLLSCYLAHHLF